MEHLSESELLPQTMWKRILPKYCNNVYFLKVCFSFIKIVELSGKIWPHLMDLWLCWPWCCLLWPGLRSESQSGYNRCLHIEVKCNLDFGSGRSIVSDIDDLLFFSVLWVTYCTQTDHVVCFHLMFWVTTVLIGMCPTRWVRWEDERLSQPETMWIFVYFWLLQSLPLWPQIYFDSRRI